jgi:hypothetical protein
MAYLQFSPLGSSRDETWRGQGIRKHCVFWNLPKLESIVTVQRKFRTKYHTGPPTDKTIREWYKKFQQSGRLWAAQIGRDWRACAAGILSLEDASAYCARHMAEVSAIPGSMYVLKHFAMWISAKWISLPAFHHGSPTISNAETVYDMHIPVLLTCKRVRHLGYDRTATQHSYTSLVYVQAGTRSCYSSSGSITASNRRIRVTIKEIEIVNVL